MSKIAKAEPVVTSPRPRLRTLLTKLTTQLQTIHKIWWQINTPITPQQPDVMSYKAKMLSSTLLFMSFLIIFVVLLRRIIQPEVMQFDEQHMLMAILGSINALVLYFFNKRGYYRFSAYAFIFTSIFILFSWLTLTAIASNFTDGYTYFYYLIVPVICAYTFLSSRVAIVVAVSNLVLMNLINFFLPLHASLYFNSFDFNLFMTVVIIVMWYYRDQMEQLTNKQLATSEQRYRLISEIISDYAYYCRIDAEGNFSYEWVTESAARVTGYSREELLNHPELIFTSYHPEDAPIVHSDILKIIEQRGGENTGEYRLITKDGQIRWVRVHRNAIYDEGEKRVNRLYGVVQDITENKRAEADALHSTLERERLSFVSQFVLAISHEFRSALASIETSRYIVQRALDKESHDAPNELNTLIASPLQVIRETVFRLARQLENLNAVSSLTNPQTITGELLPIVQAVVDEYKPIANAEAIEIRVILYNELPKLPLNRQEIKRALRQLLENAIRYTPAGGSILLRVSHLDDFAYIEVRDSGVGIPHNEQARIFDLFYKADEARTRNSSGVGLGLSIVKMIAEAHGGRVIVESQPAQGSSFTIVLPLTRREENQRVG